IPARRRIPQRMQRLLREQKTTDPAMALPKKVPGQEARTGQISMIIISRDPGKARTPGRRTATAKTEAMMKQTATAKTEAMTERTVIVKTEVMTERTAT